MFLMSIWNLNLNNFWLFWWRVVKIKKSFLLFIVYGHNSTMEHRSLWQDMRAIQQRNPDRAWLQMGDFNTVRLSSERLVGFDSTAASEFNQCLYGISQDDLPVKGFWYTWTNKRGGVGDNKSKLDRVISNIDWLDSYPHAGAVFLPPGISDHCLISVTMVPPNGGRKPFKFFNFWVQHP